MYYKSIYYALLMIIFSVLGYIFLYSGFNTKTRMKIDYQDNSDVYYKVHYLDKEYIAQNDKYVSSMVDYIDVTYNYTNLLSEYVSGYYRYDVEAYVTAYEEDITDSLWERKYQLMEQKTEVLDQYHINNIKIDDSFRIEFKEYRDDIKRFINNYNIEVSGYLHIRINILESLNFGSLNNEYSDSKVITMNLPLTNDTFKIDVDNIENRDSYYKFTSRETMNLVFMIIGIFCISVGLSLLILVIRQFKIIYNTQSQYQRELNKILFKYDDCIVRIKRFYINKKYNLIYVDSFKELMDVFEKTKRMISFKEVKRGSEAIFVIIDNDDAWIYKMIAGNKK